MVSFSVTHLFTALVSVAVVQGEDDFLRSFYSNYAPCNICGADDGVIGNEDTMLPMGTGGIIAEDGLSCSDVQAMALDGQFSPASCLLLPFRVFETCGCISSQPPPVFPPMTQESSVVESSIFITFGGLTEELEGENLDIFEEECAVFLESQVSDVSDIECSVQGQTLSNDDEGELEVDVLVSGMVGTGAGIGSDEFGSLILGALADEIDQFLEALQDASDFFDGVTTVTSGPSDDDSGQILGIDRPIFVGIVAGAGALILMLLTLCGCGRGQPSRLKRVSASP